MFIKNLFRKIKVGAKVLRDEGLIGFLILILRFGEKTLSKYKKESHSGLHLIDTKVKYSDAVKADYTRTLEKWTGTKNKKLTFNWIMPPPGKGSGGHMNIFRFIKYLEDAGHFCRIYIYTPGRPGKIGDIVTLMGDSYPEINAQMHWIGEDDFMEDADGIIATSWQTAYPSYNSTAKGKRFYFVQDFEPLFYAKGSLSVLAENTYRFGFYGITAGGWLSKKLRDEYGMQSEHFDFGADKTLYNFKNTNQRKEIFFYARPYTERRGFEMGIMALDLFHQEHPEYTINLAGWDVSTYDIPFPYRNLKTLELSQLNDLYNKCIAGLVLSFTNMSLLPLELLSSGTIPVVNAGENNELVSNNKYIAYSAANPVALADKLAEIVKRGDAEQYAKLASDSVKSSNWDASGKKFVSIIEREVRRND